ncbi:hypothetical protein GCM10009828_053410 [Actinoplanes couchii]|uniref:Uncharacterized protein n=2 Tax=Actinoplanes couchii TaxID=403638 RepID=A0ABQ3XRJ7_9ACTN|nr:hypothetical protein Aco03nite_094240 [Actinoplanes couchii]
MHLDPGARRATVWSTERVLGLEERFAGHWPGWSLDFCQDRFVEQELRFGAAFRFPGPAAGAGPHAAALAERAMEHWARGTVEYSGIRPVPRRGYDPLYGTGDAGLTVAELQRLVDLLLEPGQERCVDVAEYAHEMREIRE